MRDESVSDTKHDLSTAELRATVDRLPRAPLAHLPTPLEELPRFSAALGGPRIYIKRDDCTGLAFGGNKTRHNEFLLGDALEQGADMFVWGAGVQSNNCRQTLAGCKRYGLDCHLLLSRGCRGDDIQGNLLLDHVLGATIEIVDAEMGPELDALIAAAAEKAGAQGRHVYHWNRGRVKVLAAIGYVICMAELIEQLAEIQVQPHTVYICSSGSTGAGLALGKAACGAPFNVRSVLPLRWPWDEAEDLARIANEAAEILDLSVRLEASDISVSGDYIGPGYGVPSTAGMEAIALLARTEGILLDPVYSSKALAALIHDVRRGTYVATESLVFVHTGGTPALFAYRDELVEMVPPVRAASS